VNLPNISRPYLGINKMKIDLTTGTWQDNPGCPINITLVSTSDAGKVTVVVAVMSIFVEKDAIHRMQSPGTISFSPKGRKCQNSRRGIPSD
jgi:hypothetical protein